MSVSVDNTVHFLHIYTFKKKAFIAFLSAGPSWHGIAGSAAP